MKTNRYITYIATALLAFGVSSCTCDQPHQPDTSSKMPMEFSFTHPSHSRATATDFEPGDVVGLFVAESDANLEIAGNTVNNEPLTFGSGSWSASRSLFWNSGTYNVYAYYPRLASMESVTDLPFTVSLDQRVESGKGYEQSDFLYASLRGVEASAQRVNMQFRHVMSKITIRLIRGEDYEGEIPEKATVYIHNVVNEASIDLQAGVVTKNMRAPRRTMLARQSSPTSYTAIVVPQRLENRMPLIEVVMNGVSFLFESKFLFKPGVHHLVSLVIDKNPEQVKIEIGGEIVNWS